MCQTDERAPSPAQNARPQTSNVSKVGRLGDEGCRSGVPDEDGGASAVGHSEDEEESGVGWRGGTCYRSEASGGGGVKRGECPTNEHTPSPSEDARPQATNVSKVGRLGDVGCGSGVPEENGGVRAVGHSALSTSNGHRVETKLRCTETEERMVLDKGVLEAPRTRAGMLAWAQTSTKLRQIFEGEGQRVVIQPLFQ